MLPFRKHMYKYNKKSQTCTCLIILFKYDAIFLLKLLILYQNLEQ